MKREKLEDISMIIKQQIAVARNHRQKKVSNWKKNEALYYLMKQKTDGTRANVELGQGVEFVTTLLSKIDNGITFKYKKRKLADLKKEKYINALKEYDALTDLWDLKDIAGKIQMIIYGNAVFEYHADSTDGYKACLENVDIYDFLIDPKAGGIDIDKARFLGSRNVTLNEYELKKGVKSGIYLKDMVAKVLVGKGNIDELTNEEQLKRDRFSRAGQSLGTDEVKYGDDYYTFWKWQMVYKGEKYYVIFHEPTGNIIRCDLLKDVFSNNKYSYLAYSAYPSFTEFYGISPLDVVREVIYAKNISINQMIDNAERINKPKYVVNVNKVQNVEDVIYGNSQFIRVNLGQNESSQNIVSNIESPQSIQTPIAVFQTLEGIQSKASGVTDATKGVSDLRGKVGINDANLEQAADRFGTLDKSYSLNFYYRLAELHDNGIRDHLTKSVAIDIIGPDGIEYKKLTKKDVLSSVGFAYVVEASDAETKASQTRVKDRQNFLTSITNNPAINEKVRIELSGKNAGFTSEEIKELLDTQSYATQEVLSEAENDIEMLIKGKLPSPNLVANTAYMQHIVDYMKDHKDDMDIEDYQLFETYLNSLGPIVAQNMERIDLAGMLQSPTTTVGDTNLQNQLTPQL